MATILETLEAALDAQQEVLRVAQEAVATAEAEARRLQRTRDAYLGQVAREAPLPVPYLERAPISVRAAVLRVLREGGGAGASTVQMAAALGDRSERLGSTLASLRDQGVVESTQPGAGQRPGWWRLVEFAPAPPPASSTKKKVAAVSLRVLASEKRLLSCLEALGEVSFGELAASIGIEGAKAKHALNGRMRRLRDAGKVQSPQRGVWALAPTPGTGG